MILRRTQKSLGAIDHVPCWVVRWGCQYRTSEFHLKTLWNPTYIGHGRNKKSNADGKLQNENINHYGTKLVTMKKVFKDCRLFDCWSAWWPTNRLARCSSFSLEYSQRLSISNGTHFFYKDTLIVLWVRGGWVSEWGITDQYKYTWIHFRTLACLQFSCNRHSSRREVQCLFRFFWECAFQLKVNLIVITDTERERNMLIWKLTDSATPRKKGGKCRGREPRRKDELDCQSWLTAKLRFYPGKWVGVAEKSMQLYL